MATSPQWAKIYAAVGPQVAGIRRFGSAALDLAWVAAGRMDGFWEDDLDLWDTAAGRLLVREAGGFVTDYRGSDRLFERARISRRRRRRSTRKLQKLVAERFADRAAGAWLLQLPRSSRRRSSRSIPSIASSKASPATARTIFVSSILDRQILACRSTCRSIATLPAGPCTLSGWPGIGRGIAFGLRRTARQAFRVSRHAIAARWSRSTAGGGADDAHCAPHWQASIRATSRVYRGDVSSAIARTEPSMASSKSGFSLVPLDQARRRQERARHGADRLTESACWSRTITRALAR